MKESLSACFRLETSHVNTLLTLLAPGCRKKESKDILILVDSLRKGLFPAKVSITLFYLEIQFITSPSRSRLTLNHCSQNLEGVPTSRQNRKVKDDISLRSTFVDITCLRPQGGNDWTQQHLIEGIEKQLESERKGEDYHYTRYSNEGLVRRLEGLGVNVTFNLRLRLVQELWAVENTFDYTPNPLRVLNAQVVSIQQSLLSFLLSRYDHFSTSFELFTFIRTFLPLPPLPSREGSQVM